MSFNIHLIIFPTLSYCGQHCRGPMNFSLKFFFYIYLDPVILWFYVLALVLYCHHISIIESCEGREKIIGKKNKKRENFWFITF